MRAATRGAVVAVVVDRALAVATRGRWERTNFRGHNVSLCAGPALVLGSGSSSGRAGLVAALGAGITGLYDDAVGGRDQAKGLRGHVQALRQGRCTGGMVKVAGVGGSALLAVLLLPRRRPGQLLVDVALVAGSANLLNLLDLRPGRALKVGTTVAAGLGLTGPLTAGLVLLPGDVRERTMLGDAGANGFGAVLGIGLVERLRPIGRLQALAGVLTLMLASERVSFSAVIDRTPVLRGLDRAGRLP